MANVIYIAGVPASGKTTICKIVREKLLKEVVQFKQGAVRGVRSADGRLQFLGVFDGTAFEGTDKLSMSVIGDAIAYCNSQPSWSNILVEGDRLFNIRFLRSVGAKLFLIDAEPSTLDARHKQRSDSQGARFLRSRRTKVENFAQKYNVKRYWNNTENDKLRIVNEIISKLK